VSPFQSAVKEETGNPRQCEVDVEGGGKGIKYGRYVECHHSAFLQGRIFRVQTVVCDTFTECLDVVHRPKFQLLENTTCRKLNLFAS
jgi:hypothetical protein